MEKQNQKLNNRYKRRDDEFEKIVTSLGIKGQFSMDILKIIFVAGWNVGLGERPKKRSSAAANLRHFR